ncbi:MAG TPA: ATP-dependent DNA helicase RecG, partial [Chthoniobacteraceae bacterium]|nr:ATP-dependent DNA helicase RecG [Chthoniobacteraceae bacterium]
MGVTPIHLTPSTHLRELEWLGAPRIRALDRLGCETVGDILERYPRRYEDRHQFDRFPTGESDTPVCVCGMVKKTQLRYLRARQRMFDAVLEEDDAHALTSPLICRWFNSPWVEKSVVQGQRLIVYGKPKRSGSNIVIAHPEFEVIEEDAEVTVHVNRIAPIHRATEGVSVRVMRRLVWDILQRLNPASVDTIVPKTLDRTDRLWALRQIHFPENVDSLEKARRHLVMEEFFLMQVLVAAKRAENAAQPGAVHCGQGTLMRRLHESLPFPLTSAQLRAVDEIRGDLASSHPMNRLLHGDVGSGKTLVALSAMLLCVEAGYQAALMAPTQILAEQHYLNMRRLCEPLGLRVALRTGSRREDTVALLQETEPHLLVGTHALLYEGAGFTRLGLAVIDEQHKFGVLQRARLREQGTAPDVLVMTATPIPRTLTMTVYGDLDVSTLDEMPKGRGKIITAVREEKKLPEAVKFIREHLEAGRQAYIVYPLIDESEKLEAKAAAAEFQKWRELLAPFSCELLHGRVAPEEKDAIMERFRSGKANALIATTVIEVGIDVSNATLMLIENAERFGLAQLHQLRGRVGRGEHKSYCVLLTGAK